MALRFEPVHDETSLHTLVKAADEIWHEYWPALIGPDQTDYMVEKFQSREAISADIAEHGYRYRLLYDEAGTLVGYTGGCVEDFTADPLCEKACVHGTAIAQAHPKRVFISKIYLYAQERGKHYASRVIEFWEQMAREEGASAIYLTVNRDNELGVRAYLGRGFETIEERCADIGEGFVMDDYIMAKAVS